MKRHILLLALLLVFAMNLCHAQQSIVVNFGGTTACTPGNGTLPATAPPACNPKTSFIAESYTWSMQLASTPNGVGKPSLPAQVFLKGFDTSTVELLTSMLTGKPIPNMLISVYRNGSNLLEGLAPEYQVLLSDVQVIQDSTVETVPGTSTVETVGVLFQKMTLTFNTVNPNGSVAKTYSYTYDVAMNKFSNSN